MTYKFTGSASKAIEIANDIAMELGHNYIGTEHILYGLVAEGTGVASKVLQNQNVTKEEVLSNIEQLIGKEENANLEGTAGIITKYSNSYSDGMLIKYDKDGNAE